MIETARSGATETATYWFVKLELAVQRGDFKAAIEAQNQLKSLGVIVQYGRPAAREALHAQR